MNDEPHRIEPSAHHRRVEGCTANPARDALLFLATAAGVSLVAWLVIGLF